MRLKMIEDLFPVALIAHFREGRKMLHETETPQFPVGDESYRNIIVNQIVMKYLF